MKLPPPFSKSIFNALPDTAGQQGKSDSTSKQSSFSSKPSRLADIDPLLGPLMKQRPVGRNRALNLSPLQRLVAQTAITALGSVPGGQTAAESRLTPQVAGIRRRPIDIPMAKMAKESYSAKTDASDANAAALTHQGWDRLEPLGDHMVAKDGTQVKINPELLLDTKSGFEAGVWHRANPKAPGQVNQLIVGFAGTNPKEIADVKTDLLQAIGLDEKQYQESSELANQALAAAGKDNVAFTGHSLGGGLAEQASVATHHAGVTFNAAGLSDESLHHLGVKHVNDFRAESARNGQIRSYATAGDPLSTVNNHGAPPQLGTAWMAPAEDSQGKPVSIANPKNILALHSDYFVDGVQSQHVKPGVIENPLVNPLATVVSGLTGVGIPFAVATPAGRGAMLNTIGAAASALGDVKSDMRQPSANLAGSLVQRSADFTGATVQIVGNAIGTDIRNSGDALGFNQETAAKVAQRIEHTGDAVRDRLESRDSSKAP